MLIPNISPVQPQQGVGNASPLAKGKDGGAFEKLLRGNLANAPESPVKTADAGQLKFSSHALSRIRDRGIPMGNELMDKLEKAVNAAAEKGSRESLILSKDAAFIVSVKNKTVITVVDRNQTAGNVFTNIDSTVVI
jgi:flagellar operon protein